ncbi:MAG: C-GCAxxG-C-C family protein, partial [Promethearchaeota archaeon]
MEKVDQAVSCYMEDFTCGQAILSTYGTHFGLNRDIALKLATAFGGGIARLGETCGAVNGALMVIGLKHGRSEIKDLESKEKTYRLAREFIKRFSNRNGSIVCKDLLNCDINTTEGRKYALKNNLF